MDFHFSHDFDIDVAGYWKAFLSDEFNEGLYKVLNIKKREVVSKTDDGKIFRRVQRIDPSTPVPAIMAAIVKDNFGYTETDTLDWAKNSMEVLIEPHMAKDRFTMRGTYAVKSAGEARCRRDFSGIVKVSIPLLGGRIEKHTVEEMRKVYDQSAVFTRKWIAEKCATKP